MKKILSAVLLIAVCSGTTEAYAEGALRLSIDLTEKTAKAGESVEINFKLENTSDKPALFYLWSCSYDAQFKANVSRLVPEEPACLQDGPMNVILQAGESKEGSFGLVYLGFEPPKEPLTFRVSFTPADENMRGEPTELQPVESNEVSLQILPGSRDDITKKISLRRDAEKFN